VLAAFVIQQAMRMRPVTLSSVACLATIFFHILLQPAQLSEKKVTAHKMCVLIFYTTFG
jgi:hypothetical protein